MDHVEFSRHGQHQVGSYGGDRDDHHDGRGDAERHQPGRHRATTQPNHARQPSEHRKRPKANGSKVVTVYRAANNFGYEIVSLSLIHISEPTRLLSISY